MQIAADDAPVALSNMDLVARQLQLAGSVQRFNPRKGLVRRHHGGDI